MNANEIIKAWTDPEYRETLTTEQLAQLPALPVGLVELTDAELAEVAGGTGNIPTGPIQP
jgi:mersacidin/lichenicidin family type 2 lantibiotic